MRPQKEVTAIFALLEIKEKLSLTMLILSLYSKNMVSDEGLVIFL